MWSATRALAIELAKYGITVNCLSPGLIDTSLLRAEPPEVMERLLKAQPMGTLGSPADVAHAARFLAGPTARAVTGQVLYVCGGKSLYPSPQVDYLRWAAARRLANSGEVIETA